VVVRQKSQPGRRVLDGVEYWSARAAADALGKSYRTLTRWEKAGVIPRPDPLPGADPQARWYSAQDLEELRKLAEVVSIDKAQGGTGRLRDLLDTMRYAQPQRPQRQRWNGEEVSRRPRQFAGRHDEVETEWTPPSERGVQDERRPEPVPPPVVCGKCKTEVLWIMQPVPGAAERQIPWCKVHGAVDLSPPEPVDPNLCPSCQSTITWEMGDARGGFLPTCPVHGQVKMPKPTVDPREERAFQHQVHFGGLPPAPQRPRGLTQRDVIGAVRMSRRQPPGPRFL
jgi:hypothetical protein